MKKKNVRFLCGAAAFLLLLALILAPVQRLFARKSLSGPWDMTNKVSGFYNEPEDEFEIMFFGSSHVYASFSPLELWERTGVKSYVFSTQQQPPWATYYYIKEALKTQHPALMVVECHMILDDKEYYADAVTYSYADDIPLTWNKVKLAWMSSPTLEGKVGLLFNFWKYHGRWNELHREDFFFDRGQVRDPYKGFVMLPPQEEHWWTRPEIEGVEERTPLPEKQRYWLEEIIKLCREEGVELWLVKTPDNLTPEDKAVLNTVEDIAGENGAGFFDLNEAFDDIGLTQELFYDPHHLDAFGASKCTAYFAGLLEEYLPDLKKEPEDPAWAADLETYRQGQRELETPEEI